MATKQTLTRYRSQLRDMLPEILENAPDFNFNIGYDAMSWAFLTKGERKLPKEEKGFADSILLLGTLVDLVGADSETLYAAMLYAAMRPERDKHFNTSYLDEIGDFFKDNKGEYVQPFQGAKKQIINALQILACDLLALPHPIETVEQAFNKPEGKEAEKLAAYYILSRGLIKEKGAFAIRATEWYLGLVDMRLNPKKYSVEEKLHAYYYTDKYYSPMCEYLALEKLGDDPTYSPVNEGKGLYRLKMAMDEEMLLQLAPEEHDEIQAQLAEMLKRFDLRNKKAETKKEPKKKLFDLVRTAIEGELYEVLHELGLPKEFVRIEARLKSPRSIFQKMLARRQDIHDRVGVRMIIDIEGLDQQRSPTPTHDKKKSLQMEKVLTGQIHAALAARFEQVPKRYKNFYADPTEDGYLAVQNTFKIFGEDVEAQIVGLKSHINNSIGTAAHFFYKLFSKKKGVEATDEQKGPTLKVSDLMDAFTQAGSRIVVRTEGGFHVMKAGARVIDLARRIHSELAEIGTGATVIDYDPTNRMNREHVTMHEPLRNGWAIHINKPAERALAAA